MSARRLVLITGASAGIGAAFARAYASRGWDVGLSARRADRLETLAGELRAAHGVAAHVLPADLADPAAPAAILADLVQKAGREPDGLVNNAGYGPATVYAKSNWAEQAAFLQVMVTAPAALTHAVLPGMLGRGYGRIIQVASVAGLVPGMPSMTLYGAVKAFLIRFAQALNLECHGKGVHVSALCPGLTHSEFHDANQTRTQLSKVPKMFWANAEDVVEAAIAAVERNQAVFVPGGLNKAMTAMMRLTPDPLAEAVMKRTLSGLRRARKAQGGG
jgi:hypothetical protein